MGFFDKFFKASKSAKTAGEDSYAERIRTIRAELPELTKEPVGWQAATTTITSTTTATPAPFTRVTLEPEKPKTDAEMLQDVLDSFDG